MKKVVWASLLIGIILVGLVASFRNNIWNAISKKSTKTPIRIGWQVPWATEGQLTQILKHAGILEKYGLVADFKGFDSGAPLNEAALGGSVDVIFTADQPAATLLSKDPNWTIIGRLMYNRVSLYVPPKSPIQSIKDLKGKTVGMPFGAAAQRKALEEEQDAGLDPTKDVKNVNLGIYEQSDLVRDANATKWGSMDALAGFDPTPAIFEEKGLVRNLSVDNVVSVILMSNSYIKMHPDAPVSFLSSMNDAYQYYRDNTNQANEWFTQESKLDITSHALQIASSVEPNLQPGNQISLYLNNGDIKILQEAADFIFNQHLVKTHVDMSKYVNMSYLDNVVKK